MSSILQFSATASSPRVTSLMTIDGQDLKVLIEAALTWLKPTSKRLIL